MVVTVLAGCELLGQLSTGKEMGDAIQAYWRDYMALVNPRYGLLSEVASKLLRNGIAHSFLTKPPVVVARGIPGTRSPHLVMDPKGDLVFDCVKLYEDFRESFESYSRVDLLANRAQTHRYLTSWVNKNAANAKPVMARLNPADFPA